MKKDMDIKRLHAIIEAYGADSERWPEWERSAALALAARSQVARSLLAEAEGLDRLLDSVPSLAPSPDVRRAIFDIPETHAPEIGPGGFFSFFSRFIGEIGGWRPVAAGLAAAFVIGLVLGNVLFPSTDQAGPGLLQIAFYDFSLTGY